jgi:antitoxin component HigA of HigAB toxin-antitoxin module
MKLHPIKTESDYNAALKEIEKLFDAEINSSELLDNFFLKYKKF